MPIFHGAKAPKAAEMKIPRSSSGDDIDEPAPYDHLAAAAQAASESGLAWSPFGGGPVGGEVRISPDGVPSEALGDDSLIDPPWIIGDDPVAPPVEAGMPPRRNRIRGNDRLRENERRRRPMKGGMTPTAVTAEMTFRTAIIINRLMLATAPEDDAGRRRVALQIWAGLILGIMQFVGTRISMTEIITIVTKYALEADANGGRIPRMPIPAEQVMALLGEKILEKYHDGR